MPWTVTGSGAFSWTCKSKIHRPSLLLLISAFTDFLTALMKISELRVFSLPTLESGDIRIA